MAVVTASGAPHSVPPEVGLQLARSNRLRNVLRYGSFALTLASCVSVVVLSSPARNRTDSDAAFALAALVGVVTFPAVARLSNALASAFERRWARELARGRPEVEEALARAVLELRLRRRFL